MIGTDISRKGGFESFDGRPQDELRLRRHGLEGRFPLRAAIRRLCSVRSRKGTDCLTAAAEAAF